MAVSAPYWEILGTGELKEKVEKVRKVVEKVRKVVEKVKVF